MAGEKRSGGSFRDSSTTRAGWIHHPSAKPSSSILKIMSRTSTLFTTLIRTHHITSRKKLARVRKAALQLNINYLLIRSGGCPGIMFAESSNEDQLNEWVSTVQALRYKDFKCVRKPGVSEGVRELLGRGFNEIESVNEFGSEMERRGLGAWWRRGMGYEGEG